MAKLGLYSQIFIKSYICAFNSDNQSAVKLNPLKSPYNTTPPIYASWWGKQFKKMEMEYKKHTATALTYNWKVNGGKWKTSRSTWQNTPLTSSRGYVKQFPLPLKRLSTCPSSTHKMTLQIFKFFIIKDNGWLANAKVIAEQAYQESILNFSCNAFRRWQPLSTWKNHICHSSVPNGPKELCIVGRNAPSTCH